METVRHMLDPNKRDGDTWIDQTVTRNWVTTGVSQYIGLKLCLFQLGRFHLDSTLWAQSLSWAY